MTKVHKILLKKLNYGLTLEKYKIKLVTLHDRIKVIKKKLGFVPK